MASTDGEIINVRERPSSTDIMTIQDLLGRELLDILKFGFSTVQYGSAGSPPSWAPRNCVLNGLVVDSYAEDEIQISSGALLQNSTTLSPTLGEYDSTYRIGINRVSTSLPIAAPGADSWCLVEAQMVQVITDTASRDQMNAFTGIFNPALLNKVQERQVQFQLTTTAGLIPAFSGNDWVPICAVFRPSGGGVVTASQVVDLRVLWSNRVGRANETTPSATLGAIRKHKGEFSLSVPVGGTTASTASIQAEVISPQGERLWFRGDVDPNLGSVYAESGYNTVADEWRYVYMASWRGGVSPVNGYGSSSQGRGLLIVSAVAPTTDGLNSAQIVPGSPWTTDGTIATGDAVCIAAMKRNSTNTGWLPVWSSDLHEFLFTSQIGGVVLGSFAPPTSGDNAVVPGADDLPSCAREILINIRYDGNNGSPIDIPVALETVSSGTQLTPRLYVRDDGGHQNIQFVFPTKYTQNESFSVNLLTGSAPDAASTMSVYCFGWRM